MSNFIIILILLLFCLLSINDCDKRHRIVAIIIIGGIMIIQAGFRDYQHQINDTIVYKWMYDDTLKMSWSDCFKAFNIFAESYEDRDPGYNIFVKFTQLIWPDFRFYLVLVATIISVPLCWLIYKFVPTVAGIYFSGIVYESLFASFFMTGIRQTIAMGIVLMSLHFLFERRCGIHYLMLGIAYFIHTTTLVYLPLSFFLKLRNSRKLLLYSILMSPVFMIISKPLLIIIGTGSIMEGYLNAKNENLGTPVFSLLLVAIAITLYVLSKKFIKRYPNSANFFFCTMMMACVLMPTSWVNSAFMRVVFDYLIFIIPMIPMMVELFGKIGFTKEDKSFIYGMLGVMVLVLVSR